MTVRISTNRRKRRKSKQRNRLNLQKPSGVIGPRVKRVGGEKFAIVCVDPAKHRSEWMMADYFGNLLIEQQTLERQTYLPTILFTLDLKSPWQSPTHAAQ